jgi:hypothetical protein
MWNVSEKRVNFDLKNPRTAGLLKENLNKFVQNVS